MVLSLEQFTCLQKYFFCLSAQQSSKSELLIRSGVILLTLGAQKTLGSQESLHIHHLVSRACIKAITSTYELHDNTLGYFYGHLIGKETEIQRV